jgi:uncharacterized LabA/DUF88 family protein
MMDTLVIIDVPYLIRKIKKYGLEFNFLSLKEFLIGRKGKFYSIKAKFLAYAPTSHEIKQLTDSGFQIILETPERLGSTIKYQFDSKFIFNVMQICHRSRLDRVIIVSNDSDYVPLCKELKRHFMLVFVASFSDITWQLLREVIWFEDLNGWVENIKKETPEIPHSLPIPSVTNDNSEMSFANDSDELSGKIQDKSIQNGKKSVSIFLFYKDRNYWIIGEKGNEQRFEHLSGYPMLNMLLRYPYNEISSGQLFNEGKEFVIDEKISAQEKKSIAPLTKYSYQPTYDFKSKSDYSDKIAELEGIKANLDKMTFQDPVERIMMGERIDEEINEIKKALYSAEHSLIKNKSSRTPVFKAIKRALSKIIAELPYLEPYLNRHTIKTGSLCEYRPFMNDPVKWVLDPPDPPTN